LDLRISTKGDSVFDEIIDHHILGDINGDGKVTAADVSLIEQFCAGNITEFPLKV